MAEWTPERKAAHSAKLKAYWASKKDAQKSQSASQVVLNQTPQAAYVGPGASPGIVSSNVASSSLTDVSSPYSSSQGMTAPLSTSLSAPMLPQVQAAPITSSIVQSVPPDVPKDEEQELEDAYKEILSRKSIHSSLARFQMQELLEDSLTVQMAFKSYLRKLQQGNPLILKDFNDRVLGKAIQRVELTADMTTKSLISSLTPDQVLKLAKRQPVDPVTVDQQAQAQPAQQIPALKVPYEPFPPVSANTVSANIVTPQQTQQQGAPHVQQPAQQEQAVSPVQHPVTPTPVSGFSWNAGSGNKSGSKVG